MGRFATSLDRIGGATMDLGDVDRLARRFDIWNHAIHRTAPPVRGELSRMLATCRAYVDRVDGFMVFGSTPAAYGKDMWLEFGVRNRTRATLYVYNSGELWASGVYPAYASGGWDGAHGGQLFVWGGSSADNTLVVPPGREGRVRAVPTGPFPYLPSHSDGRITEADPGLRIAREGDGDACEIPARLR